MQGFNLRLAIDPHLFRGISDLFTREKELYSKCNIEVLEQSITKEETLEKEEEVKIEP